MSCWRLSFALAADESAGSALRLPFLSTPDWDALGTACDALVLDRLSGLLEDCLAWAGRVVDVDASADWSAA